MSFNFIPRGPVANDPELAPEALARRAEEDRLLHEGEPERPTLVQRMLRRLGLRRG